MVSMHRPASPEPIDPPPRMYRIATPGPVEEDEDEPLDIPQVAARYTSPPPPDLFTADEEEPFDVSEVLVRTGQASRLRRRGAIRIEAGRTPLTRRDNTSTVSLATTVPDDDLRYFQRDEGPTLESVTRWRGVTAQDFTDGRPLYCGGMAPRRPPSPRDTTSPLPIPSKSTRRTRTTPINSTGCGALVHDTASASERLSLWLANTPARPVVAPLEAQYVQRGPYGTLHPGTARCGCVNQGVGCTACGNSLGIRVFHCRRHQPSSQLLNTQTRPSPLDIHVYIFNPYTTTHNAKWAIPFPYDIPPPQEGLVTPSSLPPRVERTSPAAPRRFWRPLPNVLSPGSPISPMPTRAGAALPVLSLCPPTPSTEATEEEDEEGEHVLTPVTARPGQFTPAPPVVGESDASVGEPSGVVSSSEGGGETFETRAEEATRRLEALRSRLGRLVG